MFTALIGPIANLASSWMNTKVEKRLHEKNILATSLKLVSRGGIIGGKKNYGDIGD